MCRLQGETIMAPKTRAETGTARIVRESTPTRYRDDPRKAVADPRGGDLFARPAQCGICMLSAPAAPGPAQAQPGRRASRAAMTIGLAHSGVRASSADATG